MKKSILTFITLSVYSLTNAQQAPNGGFEIWKTTTIPILSITYEEPEGWQTFNIQVGSNLIKPVEKSIDKTSGSFGLLAQNVTFQSFTGGTDTAQGFAFIKFKISAIPSSVTFNYKSDIKGPKDTVFVTAITSKWNINTNSSENIGFAVGAYTTNQLTFKSETLRFFGFSGLTPDSISIAISSSGKIEKYRTPGTSILVDELSLNYNPLSVVDNNVPDGGISVYPSPASEVFYISGSANNTTNFKLFNSQGNVVKSGSVQSSGTTEIKVEDQSKGMYFIETYDNTQVRISKSKIILK